MIVRSGPTTLIEWRPARAPATLTRVADTQIDPQDVVAEPTLTVAAVARRLGVAPATLRTWARRYGLGPSSHTAGSHRRYTSVDLARLVIMRRLTHEGLSPAEAAKVAIAEPEPQPRAVRGSSAVLALVADGDDEELDFLGLSSGATVPPQRSVRLVDAAPAVRGLARAALALDANGITEVLHRHVRSDGVVATWDALVMPVLLGLGDRFEATGEGIEAEHLFSECVMGVLRATTARLVEPRNASPVLLACPGEELHSLALHALAAALAERGIGVRQFGMRMPADAMAAAVRRSGPAVVMLFASMPVHSTESLGQLGRVRPSPRVLVGGPGWPDELPSSVTRIDSIQQATEAIVSAVL